MYEDDETFQRMARGKGFHDAAFLAKILYGKKGSKKVEDTVRKETKEKKSSVHVQFNCKEGKFTVDSSMLGDEDKENDYEYEFVSRTTDYTFKPVKTSSDFVNDEELSGVKTDVYIFDRNDTSEFDAEREELKDELVAWNERYEKRLNSKIG